MSSLFFSLWTQEVLLIVSSLSLHNLFTSFPLNSIYLIWYVKLFPQNDTSMQWIKWTVILKSLNDNKFVRSLKCHKMLLFLQHLCMSPVAFWKQISNCQPAPFFKHVSKRKKKGKENELAVLTWNNCLCSCPFKSKISSLLAFSWRLQKWN